MDNSDALSYILNDLSEMKGLAFGIDCEAEHSARQRTLIGLIDSVRKNLKFLVNGEDDNG